MAAEEYPAPGVIETKPGTKTTEFWTNLFANVLALVQLIAGPIDVSDGKVVTAIAIVNGAYIASRGLAKQGVPAPVE